MLRKPRYVGYRTHKGQIVGKGDWEPIISQDTYDQALAILTAPGRRHDRGLEPKYLLSGIAVCGRCGTAMRPNMHKVRPDGSQRGSAYACPGCMKLTRQIAPVDEVVEAVMIGRLSRADILHHTAEQPDALRAAATTRDAILARMDTAADDYADGTITARQMARVNERLKTQLASAEVDVIRHQPLRVLDGMTGPGAAALWEAAPINRKREIVRALAKVTILPSGPGIRFTPEQVKIEWKQ